MVKAIWNGTVIADADDFEVVEGNVYFPPETVNMDLLRPSEKTTHCGWKGDASYYCVVVGDSENKDAAWVYRDPFEKAVHIKGHIAFWNGVEVE